MYDTFEVGNYGRLLSLEAQYEQNGVGEVSSILDYLEGDDSEIEELPEKIDLLETLGHLKERERTIIRLKFYSDLSQAEIAGTARHLPDARSINNGYENTDRRF